MHSVTGGPRILVTGGAGYVGSVLVNELLAEGYAVRALDCLLHGSTPSLLTAWGRPGFEFVRADVRDAIARRSALEGVDAVVHLAAIVGDPACARDPELAQSVNLDATRDLLTDVHDLGIRRIVFASTCSNYGRMPDDAVATEEFELRPVSLYAETKVTAELEVLAAAGNGLEACCLRFATVYGCSPRMRFDLTVNGFTRDLVLGDELVVFGEQFWRPYTHVRDAARGIMLALQAPRAVVDGEVFNVGASDENYRKADIVGLLQRRMPHARVRYVPKDEDPRDYRVAFEKIGQRLGFEARYSVQDGIDEMISLVSSGILGDPRSTVYSN
jgi:nucleoside-diphosphate-sugar epimerase